jgi:hypothetical protein
VLEVDPQAVYLSEADYQGLRESVEQVSIPRLAAASGVSERMLRYLRDGDRKPSPRLRPKRSSGRWGRCWGANAVAGPVALAFP